MGRARPPSGALALTALIAVLAACGPSTPNTSSDQASSTSRGAIVTSSGIDVPADTTAPTVASSTPRLEQCADVPVITTGPATRPLHSNLGVPILSALQRYARDHPDTYGGLWLDEETGVATIAFTDEPRQRRTAIQDHITSTLRRQGLDLPEEQLPFEVVHVTATNRELLDGYFAAAELIAEAGHDPGGGVKDDRNRSYVQLFRPITPAQLEEIERLLTAAENLDLQKICIDVVVMDHPPDTIHTGPQPAAGEGWRLLAVEGTGPSNPHTGVATTPHQYQTVWARSGVTANRPDVDFDREIVIWFGTIHSGSCDIRMDDVVVEHDAAIVHGHFVMPGSPTVCTSDANPKAHLVAVDREILPDGPFAVQVDASVRLPTERTLVGVDLSAPASTAADEQIGLDLSRFDDRHLVTADGSPIQVGVPGAYRLDLDCGIDQIGPIDGTTWSADTADLGADDVPAWADITDTDRTLLVEILLRADPPTLSLTANGHRENYRPIGSSRDPTHRTTMPQCP